MLPTLLVALTATTPTITQLVSPSGIELPAAIAASAFCDSNATAVLLLRNGDLVSIDRSATMTPLISLSKTITSAGMTCDGMARLVIAGNKELVTIDGTKIATVAGPADVRATRLLDDGTSAFVDRSGTLWHWDGSAVSTWSFKAANMWRASINRDGTAVATLSGPSVVIYRSGGAITYGPRASGVDWASDGRSVLFTRVGGLARWKISDPLTKVEEVDANITSMRIQTTARYGLFRTKPTRVEVREFDATGKTVRIDTVARVPQDLDQFVFGTAGFAVGTSARRAWVVSLTRSHEMTDHVHALAPARGMAFSPSGKTLAFLGGDDDILVAPIDGSAISRRASTQAIMGNLVGWLADGTILAGGSFSLTELSRSGASNTRHTGLVLGLTPKGELVEATTRSHTLTVNSTPPVMIEVGRDATLMSGATDLAGGFLAVRHVKHVDVFDLAKPSAPVLSSTERPWVSAAALVGTQPHVLVAYTRTVYVVDANGERVVDTLPSSVVVAVASADHQRVAIGCVDGSVIVYDAAGTVLASATSPAMQSISAIAWAPDGKRLAVASSAGIELWEL